MFSAQFVINVQKIKNIFFKEERCFLNIEKKNVFNDIASFLFVRSQNTKTFFIFAVAMFLILSLKLDVTISVNVEHITTNQTDLFVSTKQLIELISGQNELKIHLNRQ